MTPPILFLIFNRPDTTEKVFSRIRDARPSRLYVAGDGPRIGKAGEAVLCDAAQRIVHQVDWPCQLKTLFRTENLGCGTAVAEAIDWFFEQEDEGIILEDDTLAEPSFFIYCEDLLRRYRTESRVMAICGGNYLSPDSELTTSYFFSRIFDPWGWATWRRAWRLHDRVAFLRQCSFPSLEGNLIFDREYVRAHWRRMLIRAREGVVDTWDYQWTNTIFEQDGYVAVPSHNLISNVGFRSDATHTVDSNSKLSGLPTAPLAFPLVHPGSIGVLQSREEQIMANRHAVLRPTIEGYLRNWAHVGKKELRKLIVSVIGENTWRYLRSE